MNTQEIMADFQIVGYRIINLNISNDFYYLDQESEKITREIDVQYQLHDPFDFEDDKDSIGGVVTLFIKANISDGERQLTVDLQLEGGFSLNNSRDIDQLNGMLEINGCATLYSIGRSIIMGATNQVCLNGTITLPMINTFKLRENTNGVRMSEI